MSRQQLFRRVPRSVAARGLGFVISLALTGCGEEVLTEGLEEPIFVRDAQFIEGPLPGDAPLTREEQEEGVEPAPPNASSVATEVSGIRPGTAAVPYFGLASKDTVALGVQLEGHGSGYWLLPAGPPDLLQGGLLSFRYLVDYHHSAPVGLQHLLFAAVDANGNAGTQQAATVCIGSPIPDNGNACDATRQPPGVVISLSWDTHVDLDLRVTAPNGRTIESKSPANEVPTPGAPVDPDAFGVGVLDYDSNRDCAIDGRQRENVVFQAPAPGKYYVYASLFSACGEQSTRYSLDVYSSAPGDEPDTFSVKKTHYADGVALRTEANGDRKIGTFVTEIEVQ